VNSSDYITILVSLSQSGGCSVDREQIFLKKAIFDLNTDIQHHSLLRPNTYCNGLRENTNKASLYLAPTAFSHPADTIGVERSETTLNSIMTFISDNYGLFSDRGVVPTIRPHIAVLSSVVSKWKSQFTDSLWSKHIFSRYVYYIIAWNCIFACSYFFFFFRYFVLLFINKSTINMINYCFSYCSRFGSGAGGSFLIRHPGAQITPGYLPSATIWFREIVNQRFKVTLTPAQVDHYSGTPMVTIGQGLKVLSSNSTLNSSEKNKNAISVVASTVNIGFFQKIIEEALPECGEWHSPIQRNKTVTMRCFMIDQAGNVIYHPLLSKQLEIMSNIHFTQLEPLIVIDILQHGKKPLRKEMCHKLQDASGIHGSFQRQYVVSMDENGIGKMDSGDHCSKYTIHPVPGTNVFLGVVYDSCASATAFCPCSTVSKYCNSKKLKTYKLYTLLVELMLIWLLCRLTICA